MSRAELRTTLLEAAEARLPADGLQAVRQRALAALPEQAFPSTRDEDWKYTNLAPAVELSNDWLASLAAGDAPSSAATPAALPDIDAHLLVLADGLVDELALRRVAEEAGDALRLSRLRDRAASVSADGPLDALNAALLQDGLHIVVPAGLRLDRPLAIVYADGAAAASQSRVVIEIEPGASLDLVEYHAAGGGDRHFANGVTQLAVGAGAHAAYLRIQARPGSHVQVGKLAARLERDATLDYASFDLGGRLVRQDVFADITGAGAAVHLHGLYLADGDQHIDNHTRIDHRVGPAASREEYRGILNGRARCVWNGKAIVHEGADGTDAEQANHNLLLSDKAEVDTKPELEIYAEDVKCSHGATVGQLDKTALHYLRTRGLGREQAAWVLTRAFAARVSAKLPIDALRAHVDALIDHRLDELQENAS